MARLAPFHEIWSLQDTQGYLEMAPFPEKGTAAQQWAWRREVLAPFEERLAGAVGRHIAWLMGQQKSVVPSFCEHVGLPLIDDLRALEANPWGDVEQMRAGAFFANHMAVQVCLFHREGEALNPSVVHDKVLAAIERGKFKFSGADMGCDPLSGERLDVLFDAWEGIAGRGQRHPIPGSFRSTYEFTPLQESEITAQAVEVVALPVPTGELWVADWIRIPKFQELCEPLDDDRDHDINTVGGRSTRTRRYAQELGVGHVAVRSPAILQDQGVVKAGFLDNEASPPSNLRGTFSADLRWTTLIDRGHLVSLLAPLLGEEEALKQVSDYEASTPELIKIQVEPGTHHLYFSGSSDVFGKTIGLQFESEGLWLEDFQEPAFALTLNPLGPARTVSPKKMPRC